MTTRLCARVHRRTHFSPAPATNPVRCTDGDGSTCQCWMEAPKDIPGHDTNAVIEFKGGVETGTEVGYYGLTVLLAGLPGFCWLLWNLLQGSTLLP